MCNPKVEITNDKEGWVRETTTFEDGSRYICDSHFNENGDIECHEYNISADNSRHSHTDTVFTDEGHDYKGGHEEDERSWRD